MGNRAGEFPDGTIPDSGARPPVPIARAIDAFQLTPWGRLERLYERELVKLFKSFSPAALTQSAIRAVALDPKFALAAQAVATRMVAQILNVNAVSWRAAAMKATHSRQIFHALQQELQQTHTRKAINKLIGENAKLIQSIPLSLAQKVTGYAEAYAEKGLRGAQLEKDLRSKLAHLTANHIRLIARTEIAKGQTAITQTRAEQLDIQWYQWETSHDTRVRKSHRNMDKVLAHWDDPPSPEALVGEKSAGKYGPGGIYWCRCAALPIVSLDEISFPARVYRKSHITRMTRAQFEKIAKWPKVA